MTRTGWWTLVLLLGACGAEDDNDDDDDDNSPSSRFEDTDGEVDIDPGGFRFTNLEIRVHDAVNDYRRQRGLSDLELAPVIGEYSRDHSRDMEIIEVLSHDGFGLRADGIRAEMGVNGVGENVAWLSAGYPDPVGPAVQGWLQSPGHHANIVGDWNYSGVGIVGSERDGWYLTQMFAD